MKKIITILSAITLFAVEIAYSQSPQSFKYQAIARDNGGNILASHSVSFRISILQGSISGTSVYTETQTATTNQFGLANLNIGSGTVVSGNFSTISWGSNAYYVKIEFDPAGGSSFIVMGTSQLLSVPYSLYAEKSGSSLTDHDTSATNELQTLSQTGANVTLSKGGGTISIADGDTSIWKKTGNNIYYNSGSVGIGTASPGYNLDINGGNVNIENYSTFIKFKEPGWPDVAGIFFNTNGYGNANQLRFTVGGANVDPPSQTQAMVIDQSGNVGIGNTNPSSLLSVGTSSQFQINSTGNITQINNVTTSFPSIQGAASTFLKNDGSGNLSWDAASTNAVWSLTGNSGTTAGTNFTGTTDAVDWVVKTNSLERMRVMSGGNVGIGNTNPASKLDVSGTAQMTGFKLTTSPTSGYVLTSDAAGVGSWQAVAGGIGGSGTTNYLSKWTPNGTSLGNSSIFDNGNIGIGTTSPGAKIDIAGSTSDLGFATPPNVGEWRGIKYYTGDDYWYMKFGQPTSGDFRLRIGVPGDVAARSFEIYESYWGNSRFYVNANSGNVGIGTTTPASKLDVEGGISIGATYSGTNAAPTNGAIIEGNVGIGTTSPVNDPAGSKLDIRGYAHIIENSDTYVGLLWSRSGGPTSGWNSPGGTWAMTRYPSSLGDFLSIGVAGTSEIFTLRQTGNIGIGTTTPASKLDVEGGISIGATYSGTNAAPTNGAIIEGNVGIGTNSPGYKLDIYGGNLNIEHPGPFIKFKETGNNDVAGIYFQASGYGNSNQLRFTVGATNVDPSSQTQAMSIDQSGNVGIGTTSQKSKLHVKGGDVYLEDVGTGIIIKSPNGSCWRLTIDNSGGFISTAISCP